MIAVRLFFFEKKTKSKIETIFLFVVGIFLRVFPVFDQRT